MCFNLFADMDGCSRRSIHQGLTPTEGAHIMALVETYRRTLETSSLEARVLALEADSHV